MAPETTALVTGFLLGVRFHVIAAGIAAGLAAGLWVGFGEKVASRVAALLLVFFAWLAADGWTMFDVARDLSGTSAAWYDWAGVVLWGILSLAYGYALSTWVGVFVGSRVKRGTGWLSASFIAAVAPIVLGRISGSL